MKVASETQSNKEVWIKPMEFELPKGLIGFPEATQYELLINEEEAPFMWIRCVQIHELGFIVIEPSQILSDYDIELNDDDVAYLGIESAEDAILFNIVTLKDDSIESATVNLIGPIVLNRRNLKAKQVIVSNYAKYSARHPLLAESAVNA